MNNSLVLKLIQKSSLCIWILEVSHMSKFAGEKNFYFRKVEVYQSVIEGRSICISIFPPRPPSSPTGNSNFISLSSPIFVDWYHSEQLMGSRDGARKSGRQIRKRIVTRKEKERNWRWFINCAAAVPAENRDLQAKMMAMVILLNW